VTSPSRRVSPGQGIEEVARLIEESTLGTVGARQLRDRSADVADQIRARAFFGEAAWLLAGRLEQQGQTQESLTWYQRAAASGDPRAARRLLHPLARRARINGHRHASAVPGDAARPIRARVRGLLESGWTTGIVIPATAAALVVAVVAIVTTVFFQRGASPGPVTGSYPFTSQEQSAETAARTQAITWILQQVSPTVVVSCDSQVCAGLAQQGFLNLETLGPGSPDPLGSTLVVATAAIRAQFGSRLPVYAPAIIASFGTGNARIDIRWAYPGGAGAYRADLPAALRARKATDAHLLTNSNIRLSITAKAQLLSGQIDPRLPRLIATMAHGHPVRIVDFTTQSSGGGPASLLRSVDLATVDKAAHLTPGAYLNWMQEVIHVQRAQFRPARSQPLTLPDGQTVLRIEYAAPSPLR
jgi:hypothetical protein